MPLFDSISLQLEHNPPRIFRIPEPYPLIIWATDIHFPQILSHNFPVNRRHSQLMSFQMMQLFMLLFVDLEYFLGLVLTAADHH